MEQNSIDSVTTRLPLVNEIPLDANHEIGYQCTETGAEQLQHGDHACFVYSSMEERFKFISALFNEGIRKGEKAIFFLHDNKFEDALYLMEQAGFQGRKWMLSGELTLAGCKDMFFSGGVFSPETALANSRRNIMDWVSKGYSGVRTVVDMGWALQGTRGAEKLMEYEARLNYFSSVMEAITVCQYHQGLFGPDLIFNAMQTHPIVIKKSFVGVNPYYLDPEVFLSSESAQILPNSLQNKMQPTAADKRTVRVIREEFMHGLGKYGLTPQEQRVAELVLQIKSNQEISQELFISANTVKQHIKNIYRKLGINKRLELVGQFVKMLDAD